MSRQREGDHCSVHLVYPRQHLDHQTYHREQHHHIGQRERHASRPPCTGKRQRSENAEGEDQRIQLQHVLVPVGHRVVGKGPEAGQDHSAESGDESPPRDDETKAHPPGRASSSPDAQDRGERSDRGAERQVPEQPRRRRGGRERGAGLEQRPLVGDQRNPCAALPRDRDLADVLPHRHREEHLFPRRDRPVHALPQREQQAGEDERVVRGESLGVEPVGGAGGKRLGLSLDRPADHAVERIPDPGRAVVPVVVVVIEAVLRPLVPAEKITKLEPCGRRQVELLQPDRAVVVHVGLDVRLRGKPRHPVPHLPADEAEQEVLLPEVEEAVVVRRVRLDRRIVDPDRVVAEPLPHLASRTHRHEIDAELGAGGPGLPALGRAGLRQAGREDKRQAQCRPAGSGHGSTSRPSWADL